MKNLWSVLILLFLLYGSIFIGLYGCTEGDGDGEAALNGGDEDALDGDVETGPPMPVALCGMEDYDLLPGSRVGDPLAWESMPMWDLTPESINAALKLIGYSIGGPVPYGCRLHRFRYSTQDRGRLVEATAILSLPANSEIPETDLVTVLSTHGTTGFSDPCAPSRGDIAGFAQSILTAALGYITVAPDYIGMNGFGEPSTARHAYLVGEQTAIGSWDAVRAAEKLIATEIETELRMNGQVVPWGFSQGGHAALFCEHFAPYYAPEYRVPAVLAVVPPISLMPFVNISLVRLDPMTHFLLANAAAMAYWYDATDHLSDIFTNDEPDYFADTIIERVYPEETCDPGGNTSVSAIEDIVNAEFRGHIENGSLDELEPWNCFYRENSLCDSSVPALRYTPTLMVFGELDEIVFTEPMREDFDRLCGLGYKLEYLECAGARHGEGATWSLSEQWEWLKDRLDGEPIDSARLCTRPDPVCCTGSEEGVCGAETDGDDESEAM